MATGDLPAAWQDVAQHVLAFEAGLHDCVMRVQLRFGGRLDEELLVRALDTLVADEPRVAARFRPTRRGAVFIGPLARGADLLRVVPASSQPIAQLFADHDRDGPMLAAELQRGTDDTLVLRLDHRLMDGRGRMALTARLLAVYAALRARRPLPPWPGARAPRELPAGRLLDGQRLRALADDLRRTRQPLVAALPTIGADRVQPTYATAEVAAADLARWRDRARRRGATLTDLLVAGLLRSHAAITGASPDGPHRCGVQVDLRRYLDDDALHPLTNAVGMSYAQLDSLGDSAVDTLDRVLAAWGPEKDSPLFGLADIALVRPLLALPPPWIGALIRGTRRPRTDGRTAAAPALSNVGALSFGDAERELDLRAAAVFPPINPPPGVVILASTFRGALALACGFYAGCYAPSTMQRLVDGVIAEARAAAAAV